MSSNDDETDTSEPESTVTSQRVATSTDEIENTAEALTFETAVSQPLSANSSPDPTAPPAAPVAPTES
jgi:hypothetical protein